MSETSTVADRLAIIDVITRMFVYIDQKRWDDPLTEVFTPKVDFDGGFGGEVAVRPAADLRPQLPHRRRTHGRLAGR